MAAGRARAARGPYHMGPRPSEAWREDVQEPRVDVRGGADHLRSLQRAHYWRGRDEEADRQDLRLLSLFAEQSGPRAPGRAPDGGGTRRADREPVPPHPPA